MNQLDLFAGIGGISLAAEWAGIETVAFCEKEPFAQGVLRRRFPGRPIYDDVFKLTREVLVRDGITDIDIVAGGFPCQPFSNAGKRGGTADDRYLWPEMRRIVGELRPTWVFAENVDGLVSMAQSDWDFVMEDEATICEEAEMVIETIRKDLEAIGYRSIPIVIPACGVGASHRRYRIFILGYTERSGRSGRSGDQWWRADEEPEVGRCSSEALAYAERQSPRGLSIRTGTANARFECCREDVAHAEGERWQSRRAEPAGQQGNYALPGAVHHVKMWPTPQASAYKGSSQHGTKRHLEDIRRKAVEAQVMEPENKGQLNPEWVEALMNFPIGWTDLE